MPDYHPNIHHRKSIRLKGYDYSKTGWYFITICVQNRECLFGETGAATVGAQDVHVGAPLRGRPVDTCTIDVPQYGPDNKKFGVPMGEMVDWFKTMTTNEYIRGVKNQGWKRFDGKLWQRNYWEHIIRDDGSYSRIAAYILQNPSKWEGDQLNPGN